MSYIGNEPIVSATRTVTEVSATAGQTVFYPNGGYTVGKIDVIVNGAQLQSSDFTATNGSSVTLTTACNLGDDVKLVAWGVFSIANIDGSGLVDNTVTSAKLTNSGVTAGSYTYSSITVDAKGRVTTASSGASPSAFPSGTLMLFQQTAAPTGWTKQTTHDNKALRVVSGTAGSGGTTAFTSVFTNQTPTYTPSNGTLAVSVGSLAVSATTLNTTQIPSHTHTFNTITAGGGQILLGIVSNGGPYEGVYYSTTSTNASGGGGSHTHSLSGSPSLSGTVGGTVGSVTLNVQYVDLIIASKD